MIPRNIISYCKELKNTKFVHVFPLYLMRSKRNIVMCQKLRMFTSGFVSPWHIVLAHKQAMLEKNPG